MSLEHLTSTHRVKIERASWESDASGGQVKTWSTVHENVSVSIQPTTAKERLMFAQRNIEYTNKIYSSRDLEVVKEDRLIDLKTGTKYVVTGYADMAGRGEVFLIEARNTE